MAAFCTPSSVLALTIKKCKHMDEKRIMTSLPHTTLCGDIFYRYHEKIVKGDCVILGREVGQSTTFEVGPGLSVGDVMNFNVKSLEYHCRCDDEVEELKQKIEDSSKQATQKTINAFELLMAGGRDFVKKKERSSGVKEGLNQKDELFNGLVDEFKTSKVDFPKAHVNTDGPYIVQD
ncbi:uncharacterized protein LOC117336165 isoform X2 [Pecten maximus]|uniref:uncharacterized protein LOC117336165 isoform X2 n=1 Tax=Pecten maximus TaxID=6579 RepID=UPI0014582424|nr:uncharacterized protein LOC117336165 isoform X2 [Pecten maximus]